MLLDPAVIVLAGGLSEAGPLLLDPLRAELAAQVKVARAAPLLLSGLGGRAGLVGAAVLTWQMLGADDFHTWREAL